MSQVLVVEDHPDQLHRLTRLLGPYRDRFTVLPARNGREAIAALKTEPVDLVVTDIQMPDIDGIVLLGYITTYHPELPCFVTTAYGTSRLRAKLPEGIVRFFQKPFDVQDLARAILAALENRPAAAPPESISLVKFLQLIAAEEGSCRVEITSADGLTGVLYFEKGVLIRARRDNLSGESAVLALLSEPYRRYRIHPLQEENVVRNVKADLSELIRNVYGTAPPPED